MVDVLGDLAAECLDRGQVVEIEDDFAQKISFTGKPDYQIWSFGAPGDTGLDIQIGNATILLAARQILASIYNHECVTLQITLDDIVDGIDNIEWQENSLEWAQAFEDAATRLRELAAGKVNEAEYMKRDSDNRAALTRGDITHAEFLKARDNNYGLLPEKK
jgi:hypothetical protein